jgi:hypothetical protein
MFLSVTRRAKALGAAIAISAAALVPPALASSATPSKAQIRRAIQRAEHSRNLWATVNICDTKHHPGVIGVRGQMPSLSFAASMTMDVQVDYWSSVKHRFLPVPHISQLVALGDPTNVIVQGGATWKFKPPVLLSGTIRFQWKLHGKVIGTITRPTGRGYKHVLNSDPAGYSAASCRMSAK